MIRIWGTTMYLLLLQPIICQEYEVAEFAYMKYKESNIIFLAVQQFIVYIFNVGSKSEISIVSDLSTKTECVLSICLWGRKTLLGLSTQCYHVCYHSKSYFYQVSVIFKGLLITVFFSTMLAEVRDLYYQICHASVVTLWNYMFLCFISNLVFSLSYKEGKI